MEILKLKTEDRQPLYVSPRTRVSGLGVKKGSGASFPPCFLPALYHLTEEPAMAPCMLLSPSYVTVLRLIGSHFCLSHW